MCLIGGGLLYKNIRTNLFLREWQWHKLILLML